MTRVIPAIANGDQESLAVLRRPGIQADSILLENLDSRPACRGQVKTFGNDDNLKKVLEV